VRKDKNEKTSFHWELEACSVEIGTCLRDKFHDEPETASSLGHHFVKQKRFRELLTGRELSTQYDGEIFITCTACSIHSPGNICPVSYYKPGRLLVSSQEPYGPDLIGTNFELKVGHHEGLLPI